MRCQVKKTFKVRGQISRAGWESAWHLRDNLKLNAPSISHCYHGNTMTCGLVPFGYSPNTSFFCGFVLWILVLNIVVSHWSVVFYLVDTSLMHCCFTMTCGFVTFRYSLYTFLYYNDVWFCTFWILALYNVVLQWSVILYFEYSFYRLLFYNDVWFCTLWLLELWILVLQWYVVLYFE